MHTVLALALAPVLALGPAAQPVPPPDASTQQPSTEPAADGATLFRDGHYAEAAEAFAREYEASRDPALLFGRAVALQRAGNCWAAIDVFEAFIATSPPEPDVAEANRQIESCHRVLGVETTRPPQTQTQPEPESPTPVTNEAQADPPGWRRDALAGVLVGVGGPTLFAGLGLYGGSFAAAQDVPRDSEADYERKRTQVRAMAATGLTLMGIGACLAIVGAVRYGLLARRAKQSPASSRRIDLDVGSVRLWF